MIDIDKDGYIDPIDLEYFLKRFPLVANQQRNSSESKPTLSSTAKMNLPRIRTPKLSLLPHNPLTEEAANKVLIEIRSILDLYKLSFVDCFYQMDKDKDGFLNLDEWSTGIDELLSLSNNIKVKFFNLSKYLLYGKK